MLTLPTPEPEHVVPYGLSHIHGEAHSLRLLVPLLPWHGTKYWFWDDSIIEGWWLSSLSLSFVFSRSSFRINLQWGSRPIGRNKPLQIDPRR